MAKLFDHATNDVSPDSDRMWPLDISIAALAGLVLYLIVSRLSFSDARWQYNAITYMVAVPVIAMILAFLLRGVASRYVQKSIQIGLLFSVSLHLLLLILATGVIIFSRYYPQSVMGVKPERSPVSRTVPEYLFKTAEKRDAEPDWSKPAETDTASPIVPREQRQLPPVEQSAPQLEMPQPQRPIRQPSPQHLLRRETPSESTPQPSNSPAKLARRSNATAQSSPQQMSKPIAPNVPVAAEATVAATQRSIDDQPRRRRDSTVPSEMPQANSQPKLAPVKQPQRPLAGLRQSSDAMPRIGSMGLTRPRRRATTAPQASDKPAGAAPAPRAVAIAKQVVAADRMIALVESTPIQRGKATGAQLTSGESPAVASDPSVARESASVDRARSQLAAAAGMPDVRAGKAMRQPGRSKFAEVGRGDDPAGLPTMESVAQVSSNAASDATESASQSLSPDLSDPSALAQMTRNRKTDLSSSVKPPSAPGPTLDLMLSDGPIGFGDEVGKIAGVVPSTEQPRIAALDLTTGSRPRREVGGPVTPFGAKVASVESFNRRIMRTEGGQSPTPAGLVGPATEEAIERGLAYLDSIQNENGSWSLQGHGGDVILRSDTAATGLCLLAFQGAGYTHKQHQYADSISRGLEFLIENQKSNGDLYRSENAMSDRNVAFYSHGIAALAMSEAYGMTQDEELKKPAQSALDFIALTQHRTRGGWRYTPQVSADTSVSGWMMMALKSGQLSGLEVSDTTYQGIDRWLSVAQSPKRRDRYRYDPYAPDTPTQRHGRTPTPTMTSVGMLMRMYSGWRRDTPAMQSAADYLLEYPPQMGSKISPQRDAYYWYYATQVMFHMGGEYWEKWNRDLNPVLLDSQIDDGPHSGSWDPMLPVRDRWSVHAGRLYVTTMNLLNLEVYYRHLPIYENTAE